MADEKDLKIGLEVTTGASQPNLEKGIVAPLKEVDAAGKAAATSVTAGVKEIEAATQGAAAAEEKLVTATEQVAEAGQGAGEGIAAGLEKVTEAAAGAVAAQEEVAQASEGIATAGEESAATTSEALTGVAEVAATTSEAIAGIGEAATTAGEEATTALEETTAAAEETAAAAQQIGPAISEGFTEVADQAQLVQNAIDRFYQRLADGLAPGRGALRQITAQYAILQEQIAEADTLTAEEAEAAQANYQRIGLAIQGVITKQREFNAEMKTANIATQEGGAQLAMLGMAAEHVGKVFGDVGEAVGKAAGEVGILALAAEHLPRMFEAMNLNELGGGLRNVSIQAGLVAAVFALAYGAGTKFAESNELNKQVIDDLTKSLKDLVAGGGEFGKFTGEAQAGIQALTAHIIESKWSLVDFVNGLQIAIAAANGDGATVAKLSQGYGDLSKDIDAATKAQDKEHLSARIAKKAYDALKASTHDLSGETHTAADEIGKLEQSTSKLDKTSQFYLITQKLGAAGQKLLNQAVDEANGSEDKLREIITKLQPELQKLVEDYRKAKEAVDLRLDSIKKQIDEEKKLIETEQAEGRAIAEKVVELGTEEAARKKLHDTIKGEIDDLSKLDTAHGGTSGSIQDVANHIGELTARFDDEQPAIDQLSGRLQALAKNTVGLSDDTKKHVDTITTAIKSVDDLTQKNKDLQAEENKLVDLGQQMTKADYDRIQAIDHEIASNQISIQQAKDKITSDAQLLAGQAAETKATTELFGAAGKATEAQNKLTESTKNAGTAAKGATTDLGSYAKGVELSKEKAAELSDASKGISVSIDGAAESAGKAVPKVDAIGTGFSDVGKQVVLTKKSVDDVGTAIGKTADSSKEATDLLKKVATEMQDEWKKSGLAVDEHTKRIQELKVQYQELADTAKKTIDGMITGMQKLDDVTKKTAGSGAGASGSGSSQYPAPIGPTQGASVTGGGTSGHS